MLGQAPEAAAHEGSSLARPANIEEEEPPFALARPSAAPVINGSKEKLWLRPKAASETKAHDPLIVGEERSEVSTSRILLAFLLLGGLCGFAYWKKHKQKPDNSRPLPAFRTIAQLKVQPEAQLSLVQIGQERYLIGSSPQGVTLLRSYSSEEAQAVHPTEEENQRASHSGSLAAQGQDRSNSEKSSASKLSAARNFHELLAKAQRSAPRVASTEAVTPPRLRVAQAQEEVQSSEDMPAHLATILEEPQRQDSFGSVDGQAASLAQHFANLPPQAVAQ
ncbi:MAG: flagellar biosynthetic protein FliO [Polyangiaceae bacterium]|nr:flagellar biosynthetic protein FliO [Polyangiaceae bacterium]